MYKYIYIYKFAPAFCRGDSTIHQSLVVVFLLSAGTLVFALPALRMLSRHRGGRKTNDDPMKVGGFWREGNIHPQMFVAFGQMI